MCLKHGPSVLLLFGFEFAILGAGLGADACKYLLYAIEQRRYDGTWPPKAQYAFFVDFIAEVLRFAAYVVFFSIVFAYYGVPAYSKELWASYVQLQTAAPSLQEVPSVNGEHGRKVSSRD